MSCQNFYFNDARDGLNWHTRLVFRSFMKYKSTRGQVADLGFSDALLMGLASDGGLLVPENIPDVRPELEHWRDLNFIELAQELIPKFIDDIDSQALRGLISESYASFSHADVVA